MDLRVVHVQFLVLLQKNITNYPSIRAYIRCNIFSYSVVVERESCVQIPFFKERKEGREERSHVKQNIIDHLLFYTAYSSKGSF